MSSARNTMMALPASWSWSVMAGRFNENLATPLTFQKINVTWQEVMCQRPLLLMILSVSKLPPVLLALSPSFSHFSFLSCFPCSTFHFHFKLHFIHISLHNIFIHAVRGIDECCALSGDSTNCIKMLRRDTGFFMGNSTKNCKFWKKWRRVVLILLTVLDWCSDKVFRS
jgi:hypothetical protein